MNKAKREKYVEAIMWCFVCNGYFERFEDIPHRNIYRAFKDLKRFMYLFDSVEQTLNTLYPRVK